MNILLAGIVSQIFYSGQSSYAKERTIMVFFFQHNIKTWT